jgi:drug/metabolite transporter (DMT)-like permease
MWSPAEAGRRQLRLRIAQVSAEARTGSARAEPRDRRPLAAIGLKVASVLAFVLMFTCLKVAGDVPAGQLVFFRSAFAFVPLLLIMAWRKQLKGGFRTKAPLSHVARGLVGVSSMGLGFFALTRLPLPEAVTLGYAQPLLIVVFSALFMGELVRAYRWAAVCVGFVGVLVISWPKLTLFTSGAGLDNAQAIGVAAALTSAAASAIAMLLVRRLVHTERSATIVLWFTMTSTVVALMTLPFGWVFLNNQQFILLVTAGLFGGLGQIAMTESYRHAEASTVAPFEYTSMIWATVAGYLVFSELPSLNMLVGGSIVVAAGIFIIWREHRLGLERGTARQVSPPSGT